MSDSQHQGSLLTLFLFNPTVAFFYVCNIDDVSIDILRCSCTCNSCCCTCNSCCFTCNSCCCICNSCCCTCNWCCCTCNSFSCRFRKICGSNVRLWFSNTLILAPHSLSNAGNCVSI